MKVSVRECLVLVLLSAITCLGVTRLIQGSYRDRAARHSAMEDRCLYLYIQATRRQDNKQAAYMLGRAGYHDRQRRRYERAFPAPP